VEENKVQTEKKDSTEATPDTLTLKSEEKKEEI
jgi:hypothetical protein